MVFLKESRERIEQAYDCLLKELPDAMGEIDGKIKELPGDTALAMKYLYATMPCSDIANYPFEIYLDYASHGVYLYEHSDYVKQMPEELFLNYVLYHRINEEEIAPCRTVFYEDLKGRIQGMGMKEAALEINYWCMEKATYQSTDDRTAAPITVYRCGHGRCGEESTFTVSALRSAGIPARQVYAPRWSHCDDNHAWVEFWCDGTWYFTGACEPEPIPNKGWFTNASSRAMLIHSRWFDNAAPSGEDVIGREGRATILNQLTRYAATKKLTILVKDENGAPVSGAQVDLEILNYSEFYPIAVLTTGENGEASMVTGLGSIHVHVCKDGVYSEALVDTRTKEEVTILLKGADPTEEWNEFDVIAPVDTPVNTDQPTEEQKAVSEERITKATEIRLAKVKAFVPAWKKEFLKDEDRELRQALMDVLTVKDRIDADPKVLEAHFQAALAYRDSYSQETFVNYVLNPRIAMEVLSPWREDIQESFSEKQKEAFRREPKAIYTWITQNLTEKNEKERESIFTTPAAALKLRIAGKPSWKILFVAIARTLGIASRLNPVDGSMEYWENGQFVSVEEGTVKNSHLTLKAGEKTWTYFQDWSLARLDNGRFVSLKLADTPWEEGRMHLALEKGVYRLLTSNRLPNGNIFAKELTFVLEDGADREVTMEFRMAKLSDMLENIAILPFYLLDENGNRVEAGPLTAGEKKILFWLEESKEPTEHILNELMERREEFLPHQKELYFIIRTKEALKDPTLSKCLNALPDVNIYYDTFKENVNTLGRRMYVDPDKLPLIVMTDGELNGVYATSGYNVGTADMLLRIMGM